MNAKTIFVTGATGKQGGSVARHLVRAEFLVKALTRNLQSPQALALQALNIEVVRGDLNNPDSYRHHLTDVYGIFSVQTFENGVAQEIYQGKSLATAGKESGTQHFVYSSVFAADLHSGVPHLDSKFIIEMHLKQLNLPFTIIRPVSFYENFLIPQTKKGILKGKLIIPLDRHTIQQHIAVDDIGKAVSRIFQQPAAYMGKTLPLASEQLNLEEVAMIFSQALGKRVTHQKLPALIVRLFLGKDLYKMFKWFDAKNQFSLKDLELSQQEFPDLLKLKDWIKINFI